MFKEIIQWRIQFQNFYEWYKLVLSIGYWKWNILNVSHIQQTGPLPLSLSSSIIYCVYSTKFLIWAQNSYFSLLLLILLPLFPFYSMSISIWKSMTSLLVLMLELQHGINFHFANVWPALAKQGTSRKQQAADFIYSTQHCRVFMVSDNHLDQYFLFVKDMLL